MTDEEARWAAQFELVYLCQLTRLYHQKRDRFYALMDRSGKALSLVAGTAAFSSLLSTAEQKSIAGLAVALFTLPGLVFAWSDRSRLHNELAGEYAKIEADIAAKGMLEWPEIDAFKSRIISLGTKEPPSLSALVRQCQNELALAASQPDKARPLTLVERLFLHFLDMPRNN